MSNASHQDAAASPAEQPLEQATAVAPALRVFDVEIVGHPLGKIRFIAENEKHAYERYKEFGGITSDTRPKRVVELTQDTEGYKAKVKDWNNARAAEKAEEAEKKRRVKKPRG